MGRGGGGSRGAAGEVGGETHTGRGDTEESEVVQVGVEEVQGMVEELGEDVAWMGGAGRVGCRGVLCVGGRR